MRIIILLLLLIIVQSSPAMAKTRVVLDKIETIQLNANDPKNINVYVPKTGLLKADIFSTSGISGNIHIEYQSDTSNRSDAIMETTPVGNKVVNKGEYSVNIWADNNQVGQLQVRFVLEPALDIYEPNNTLANATSITPPYLGLIRISAGDEDWFRVDEPKDDVIGVHLRTRDQYKGPEISFHDASGVLLYGSSKDEWGHRGMRYYRSEGSPVFVKIIDNYEWNTEDVRAFRQLVIETYPPSSDGANLFVKIDMNSSENSAAQVDFISDAAGSRITSAAKVEEISAALEKAFRPDKFSIKWREIIGSIFFLIIFGIGWLYWKLVKTK